MDKVKTCWSVDGELFVYDSLAMLLALHPEKMPGDIVYLGDMQRPGVSDLIDADEVIEGVRLMALEIGSEFAEGYPQVSEAHRLKLQALLSLWLGECPPPAFYGVESVIEHQLTQGDFPLH